MPPELVQANCARRHYLSTRGHKQAQSCAQRNVMFVHTYACNTTPWAFALPFGAKSIRGKTESSEKILRRERSQQSTFIDMSIVKKQAYRHAQGRHRFAAATPTGDKRARNSDSKRQKGCASAHYCHCVRANASMDVQSSRNSGHDHEQCVEDHNALWGNLESPTGFRSIGRHASAAATTRRRRAAAAAGRSNRRASH